MFVQKGVRPDFHHSEGDKRGKRIRNSSVAKKEQIQDYTAHCTARNHEEKMRSLYVRACKRTCCTFTFSVCLQHD